MPPAGGTPQQAGQPQYPSYPGGPYPGGPYPGGPYPGGPYPGGPSPYGPPGRPTATPDGAIIAGPGRRLGARFIDGSLQLVLTLVLGWSFLTSMLDALRSYLDEVQAAVDSGGAQPGPFDIYGDPAILSGYGGLLAVQLVVAAVYYVTFTALRGATPGKMALGLRVRPWAVEARPGWGRAIQRWATTDLPGLIIPFYQLLDSLWLLWDPRRQCLHDKWPDTVVVRTVR